MQRYLVRIQSDLLLEQYFQHLASNCSLFKKNPKGSISVGSEHPAAEALEMDSRKIDQPQSLADLEIVSSKETKVGRFNADNVTDYKKVKQWNKEYPHQINWYLLPFSHGMKPEHTALQGNSFRIFLKNEGRRKEKYFRKKTVSKKEKAKK